METVGIEWQDEPFQFVLVRVPAASRGTCSSDHSHASLKWGLTCKLRERSDYNKIWWHPGCLHSFTLCFLSPSPCILFYRIDPLNKHAWCLKLRARGWDSEREEIQHLPSRSSFSSWGDRQRTPRFPEWCNAHPGRSRHSTCRGMEPGQSKNIQEPARADMARKMGTLEAGGTAYVRHLDSSPYHLITSIDSTPEYHSCPSLATAFFRRHLSPGHYLLSNHRHSAIDSHGSLWIKALDFRYAKQKRKRKQNIDFLSLQNPGLCKSKYQSFPSFGLQSGFKSLFSEGKR